MQVSGEFSGRSISDGTLNLIPCCFVQDNCIILRCFLKVWLICNALVSVTTSFFWFSAVIWKVNSVWHSNSRVQGQFRVFFSAREFPSLLCYSAIIFLLIVLMKVWGFEFHGMSLEGTQNMFQLCACSVCSFWACAHCQVLCEVGRRAWRREGRKRSKLTWLWVIFCWVLWWWVLAICCCGVMSAALLSPFGATWNILNAGWSRKHLPLTLSGTLSGSSSSNWYQDWMSGHELIVSLCTSALDVLLLRCHIGAVKLLYVAYLLSLPPFNWHALHFLLDHGQCTSKQYMDLFSFSV